MTVGKCLTNKNLLLIGKAKLISPLKWQILEITAIFWREQQIDLWFINFGLAESIECMYRLNQVSVFESKTLDVGLSNTSHIKSTVDLHHVLSSFCAALSHTSLPSVWYKRFIRTTPDYNCFALHHLIGVIAPQVITVIVFLRVRYAKQKGGNEKKKNAVGCVQWSEFLAVFLLDHCRNSLADISTDSRRRRSEKRLLHCFSAAIRNEVSLSFNYISDLSEQQGPADSYGGVKWPRVLYGMRRANGEIWNHISS